MTGFRILDQFPVYLDRLGMPASGGYLAFFDTGTDTPKDVFGDPDLTVNNGSTVLIDSAGRTVVDVWGSGAYRVRLYAADDTLIAEAEDVEIPGGTGAVIPALEANKFLTNDGGVLQWAQVLQVPDPTGAGGKVLGTDGTNTFWQSADINPPVSNGSIKLGDTLIQWGTDVIAPSGVTFANKTINFPTAFSTVLHVQAAIKQLSNVAELGGIPAIGCDGWSNTGANIVINFAYGETSGYNIINSCGIAWIAIGKA